MYYFCLILGPGLGIDLLKVNYNSTLQGEHMERADNTESVRNLQ